MALFNNLGLILAGFLAGTLILHVALFGGVLTYPHAKDWLQRWQEKRTNLL